MKDPFRRRCQSLFPSLVLAVGGMLAAQAADSVETLSASLPAAKMTLAIEGLPRMEKLESGVSNVEAAWRGKLEDGTVVDVFFWLLPPDLVGSPEPSNLIQQFLAVRPKFVLKKQVMVGGPYGYAPCLALGTAVDGDRASIVWGCGVFETGGYTVEVDWQGALTDGDRDKLSQALSRGIKWEGKPWDPKWSAAELADRWRLATGGTQPPDKVIRTAHYVVMTDSRAGQTFAEKVEENYKAIFAQFPFEEQPCDRLMPVFVMKEMAGYQGLCIRLGLPDYATTTRGHAARDYYATWYESPGEKVHLHEMTHQIFANRLRLSGGGSWFQEGVAELVSTTLGQRRSFATQAAKRGTFVPFKQFFSKDNLLGQQRTLGGESVGERQYAQAASLMEFLRDSPFGKKGFPRFIREVGAVPYGDFHGIEMALWSVYGATIIELEREYVDWWKKR